MSHDLLNDTDFLIELDREFKTIERVLKEKEWLRGMSDEEILNKAIKSWVRMTGWERIIQKELAEGNRNNAITMLKQQVRYSGCGGAAISYSMRNNIAEIQAVDGRLFKPTLNELVDRYLAMEENISLF